MNCVLSNTSDSTNDKKDDLADMYQVRVCHVSSILNICEQLHTVARPKIDPYKISIYIQVREVRVRKPKVSTSIWIDK